MVKKPLPAPEPAPGRRTGRTPGPVEDLRSERLVQRIHPDLMSAIMQRAREAGFSRSLYVERILVQFMNSMEGAELDAIGKRRPPGQAAAFGQTVDQLNQLRPAKPKLTYDAPGIGPGMGKRQDAEFLRQAPRPPRAKKT
jgi:hypothetical protein